MNIAICDDEFEVALCLKEIIQTFEFINQLNIMIYTSGSQLFNHLNEIDAVFLDIDMPEIDGIMLGSSIKKKKPECTIIIETARIERFKEAFIIQAMRFITKPYNRDEIQECLKALLVTKIGCKVLDVYHNRILYQIPQYEIIYIRAYNGYTECYTKNKVFRRDQSLNDVEGLLDQRLFVRIHRQFIVNLKYVQKFDGNKLMIMQHELRISRRKWKDFEQRYIDYDLKYRRGS